MDQHYKGDATGLWQYQAMAEDLDTLLPGLFQNMELCRNLPGDGIIQAIRALSGWMCGTNNLCILLARYKLWQIPADLLEAHFREAVQGIDSALLN